MTMDKFLAGKRRMDSGDYHMKGTFEERYRRVTLYFELPLFDLVQVLRQEGKITNMTHFVNKAISYYLENNPL